jgi:hypothetical protein
VGSELGLGWAWVTYALALGLTWAGWLLGCTGFSLLFSLWVKLIKTELPKLNSVT